MDAHLTVVYKIKMLGQPDAALMGLIFTSFFTKIVQNGLIE